MAHTTEFIFKRAPAYRKGVGGKNIYTAIASTATLDRDKEVLIPKGVITENFMKNPVMLFIHNSRQLPVGRVLNVDVTEEAVKFDFEFDDDEVSADVERRYSKGFMNAFSVGFIPKSYIPLWDLADDITSLDVTIADGSSRTIDLTKYPERPYGIIPKWELLEISPVPVPSNPDALLVRAKDEIVRKCVDTGMTKAAAAILSSRLNAELNTLTRQINQFVKGAEEDPPALANTIPYEKAESATDTTFDAVLELGNLAVLCSSDQSGDKATIDWAAFSKAFAYFNPSKADSLTSYKFQHHVCSKDHAGLVLSKAALFSAMSELLKNAEAMAEEDLRSVYEHLAKHYTDVDMDAPVFELAYTEDQLKAISEGNVVTQTEESETSVEEEKTVIDSDVTKLLGEHGKKIEDRINELEKTLSVRMHVIQQTLAEVLVEVVALKVNEDPESDEQDTTTLALHDALGELKTLLNF